MTGLEDMTTIRDELRECCSKQLNTRIVQMHGTTVLGSCDESSLLGVIKAIAVKGVHKEVYRAAFQGMHQQQGELYQAYAARLKAKADLGQYCIKAPKCGGDLCTCLEHGRQLCYRDNMVGTKLVTGAYNKEHQARLLSESASLLTLQDKLDRLCSCGQSTVGDPGREPHRGCWAAGHELDTLCVFHLNSLLNLLDTRNLLSLHC